jgi:hypothetical protein
MRILLQAIVVFAVVVASNALADDVDVHRLQLENGIRVVIVHAPDAPRQAIFTFLPLTMANDEAGRAQWSHLLEHMLIRSTDPIGLSAEGVQFNGETTHTYLRLETFSEPAKWTEALRRHFNWLTAKSFDAGVLEREKANIAMEERGTAERGYTSKFALAAWHQAFHHGAQHASVHEDVSGAPAQDVEHYAQRNIPFDGSITIATIGPRDLEQARADIAATFGPLKTRAANNPSTEVDEWEHGKTITATWDLPTRHAMWFWRLPDRQSATLAAATVMAQSVLSLFHTDVELHGLVRQGMVYACIDSPHGPLFLIDCCLPEGKSAAEVWTRLADLLKEIAEGGGRSGMIGWLAPMLARQIDLAPDFTALRQQLPEIMKVNAEGVWLLTLMNYEYPWGVPARRVHESLANIDKAAVKSVMDALLTNQPCTLTLEQKLSNAANPQDG